MRAEQATKHSNKNLRKKKQESCNDKQNVFSYLKRLNNMIIINLLQKHCFLRSTVQTKLILGKCNNSAATTAHTKSQQKGQREIP